MFLLTVTTNDLVIIYCPGRDARSKHPTHDRVDCRVSKWRTSHTRANMAMVFLCLLRQFHTIPMIQSNKTIACCSNAVQTVFVDDFRLESATPPVCRGKGLTLR